MLASKYGLDFDFERFERAATVLMGKGWKEKLKKYMEKYAGEYLAHLDYFQG